ncbi:MAG: CoA pyrophosphatase [Burkholderiaceae bacterium]|jgi:8-oxo-dGTP pyrophosphatase MutT (NUDIX family)|nr:CoA pyrophosphatase [Burkholderiaceae bacterium]
MAELKLDPATRPIDSVADEPPVPPERLNTGWLRSRFANPREWQPEAMEEKPLPGGRNRWVPAAVLIPLVARKEDDLWLMLTRRAAHLHDHAGQISFPGGRVDLTDSSRIETALREMEEEVGVEREQIEILGTLPQYRTGSGYSITPVVAIVRPPFAIRTDPMEVAEVFDVPFSWVMTGAHYQRRSVMLPDFGPRTFYTIPYKHYMIWGATAGMLRNLFHFMRA